MIDQASLPTVYNGVVIHTSLVTGLTAEALLVLFFVCNTVHRSEHSLAKTKHSGHFTFSN